MEHKSKLMLPYTTVLTETERERERGMRDKGGMKKNKVIERKKENGMLERRYRKEKERIAEEGDSRKNKGRRRQS